MTDFHARFDAANKAFDDNTILDCDDETLQKHLLSLSIENVPNQGLSHRNVIRGLTINHILLQRHIDCLNKQNSKIQKWVIALAVVALIAGAAQAIAAILPYVGIFPTPPTASEPPKPVAQSSIPTPAKPPASHPASGQKP